MIKDKFLLFIYMLILLCYIPGEIFAQPYLDIISLKYANSPNAGIINHNRNDVSISYYNLSTNLPLQFKNKKDALIFSPFVEAWSMQIKNDHQQNYYGIALPVSLSKTIPHSKWSILLTAIVRMNDSLISSKAKMQAGGAFILSNKRTEKLTWKLGLYVNGEFFGVFIMPLAGIDWKINERNTLFGVLPGNLTFEHKINKRFYYGANFRAITNSYATANGYWRMDENQLGIYLDTYFNKNIVLNIEAGHSLFRKMRTGVKDISKYDADVNDNFYMKISFAYRVRFRK